MRLIWEDECTSSFSVSQRVVTGRYGQIWFGQALSVLFFSPNEDFTGICLEGHRVRNASHSAVCTCQTCNLLLAAPVIHCEIRSQCRSKVPSVLIHNPQLGVSIQTEQSHFGKLEAFNEN